MLLVAGDLSTTMFHLPIHVGVAAFATCTFSIYLAAAGLAAFHHPLAVSLLVVAFSCGTFPTLCGSAVQCSSVRRVDVCAFVDLPELIPAAH